MSPDARVRRIAEGQRGQVTGEQLRACGLTDKQIHLRRKRGELVWVLPGIFRLSGAPESFKGLLTATELWMGNEGFFNAATAAHLLGLDGIERPDRISVARYSGLNTPSWLKVCRLDASDVPPTRRVGGFRICLVERILAECAATHPARQVGRALDDALRRRLTTLDRMQSFAEAWGRGRRGGKLLRELLRGRDDRDEKVRSLFEARMLTILRRIREYRFVADFEVRVNNDRYVLDFYFPAAKLGIECHSFRWHMGRHNADARRDRRIGSLGIEILYFTWDDVCGHPDAIENEIRSAIVARVAIYSA